MSSSHEESLLTARALAKASAWPGLLDLIHPLATDPARLPGELNVLYAEALVRLGLNHEAYEWLTRCEAVILRAGDHYFHRHALNLLGVALFGLGRLDDATQALSKALDLANTAADLLLFARAANNLGAIANLQGRYDDALSYYRLSIPAYQRVGNRRGIAETHHNIAVTHRDLGQLDQADDQERMASDFAAKQVAPRVLVMSRIGRAEVAMRRGDLTFAEMAAKQAIVEAIALDDPINEADATRLLGTALSGQSRCAEALEAFERALKIGRERNHALTEAETLRDRSAMHAAGGASELAMNDIQKAIGLFEQLGVRAEKERLLEQLRSIEQQGAQ